MLPTGIDLKKGSIVRSQHVNFRGADLVGLPGPLKSASPSTCHLTSNVEKKNSTHLFRREMESFLPPNTLEEDPSPCLMTPPGFTHPESGCSPQIHRSATHPAAARVTSRWATRPCCLQNWRQLTLRLYFRPRRKLAIPERLFPGASVLLSVWDFAGQKRGLQGGTNLQLIRGREHKARVFKD